MLNIVGSFLVRKNNVWSSNIKYQMLFLNDRILFVSLPNQTSEWLTIITPGIIMAFIIGPAVVFYGLIGALIAGFLGGGLVFGIVSLFIKRTTSKNEETSNDLSFTSVADAIKADKKNFEIRYCDIVNTEIKKSSGGFGTYGMRNGILNINGKKKVKLDILDEKDKKLEELKRLVLLFTTQEK